MGFVMCYPRDLAVKIHEVGYLHWSGELCSCVSAPECAVVEERPLSEVDEEVLPRSEPALRPGRLCREEVGIVDDQAWVRRILAAPYHVFHIIGEEAAERLIAPLSHAVVEEAQGQGSEGRRFPPLGLGQYTCALRRTSPLARLRRLKLLVWGHKHCCFLELTAAAGTANEQGRGTAPPVALGVPLSCGWAVASRSSLLCPHHWTCGSGARRPRSTARHRLTADDGRPPYGVRTRACPED